MWWHHFHKYMYLCLTCAKNYPAPKWFPTTKSIHDMIHTGAEYISSASYICLIPVIKWFLSFTHCGQLTCVKTFSVLFTQKPISNSCRMISAVGFRVTHFLKRFVKLTLNTSWHIQQNRWLPPNGLSPFTYVCVSVGGGGVLQQKPFSCSIQGRDVQLVGLHIIESAVNPSNSHGNSELTQTMT